MARLGFVTRMASWLRGEHEEVSSFEETLDTATINRLPIDEDTFGPAGISAPVRVRTDWSGAPEESRGREIDSVPPRAALESEPAVQEMARRFTRATDALVEIRDGLGGMRTSLEEIPEAARAQTRFLNVISDRLEASELHQRELLVLMRDLPHSNTAQVRALERTNNLIDEAMKTVGPLALGFNRLANTMQSLNESSERHLMCLGILADRQERAAREHRADFLKHQKVVLAILTAIGLVALAGLILSICVLLR